jgi:hypothetical protein
MNCKLAAIIFISLLLSACAGATPATGAQAQAEPSATEVPPTATSEPTATPDLAVTETAAAEAAEAQALVDIAEDLAAIGYSSEGADLVFLQTEPFEIANPVPRTEILVPAWGDVEYGDFIMGIAVTYSATEANASGCSIAFHWDGNGAGEDVYAGGVNTMYFWTSGEGNPAYWEIGLVASAVYTRYTGRATDVVNAGSGSTNEYVFITDGNTVTIFANGTRIGETTMPPSRLAGRFGFVAWQGQDIGTTCTFEDMWVLEVPEG